MNKVYKKPWENGKKTIFPDIAGWSAISTSKEERPGYEYTHFIFDNRSKNVAFINANGVLSIIGTDRNSYKTDRKFKPSTELKQAVRYVYLMLQNPIS